MDQGNLRKSKPTKTHEQIKREPRWNGETRVILTSPEWLQEFREILVDDEIPLQGGSHASSSHEASLEEPIFKRREDLGKHSVFSHFPKDLKLRDL